MEKGDRKPSVIAVSGGGDSTYLLDMLQRAGEELIIAHVNHGTRGKDSLRDQEFVEEIARRLGYPCFTARMHAGRTGTGFEDRARRFRRRFLLELKDRVRAGKILMAHTADDQVETILMRFFEGAGISGLKGIPRKSGDGIVRPILHVWKEDILEYLKEHKIPHRVDKSNLDTRFERNWVRHVLIPLLEKRYGKAVKKRIYTLGERFRELDDYLETEARKWIRRNVKSSRKAGEAERIVGKVPSFSFPRAGYSLLPTVLRVRIIQRVCFDLLGLVPNERLLLSGDRMVCKSGPSARLKVDRGWELVNRYGQAAFVFAGDGGRVGRPPMGAGPGESVLEMEEKGKVTPAQARRAAVSGGKEYFDLAGVKMPLSVRPLRAGDRIRPFGLDSEKKVKEILVERKIPRDERWGRPVVCDAEGKILWIPGVVRSAHAPLTSATRKTVVLGMRREPAPRSRSRK